MIGRNGQRSRAADYVCSCSSRTALITHNGAECLGIGDHTGPGRQCASESPNVHWHPEKKTTGKLRAPALLKAGLVCFLWAPLAWSTGGHALGCCFGCRWKSVGKASSAGWVWVRMAEPPWPPRKHFSWACEGKCHFVGCCATGSWVLVGTSCGLTGMTGGQLPVSPNSLPRWATRAD